MEIVTNQNDLPNNIVRNFMNGINSKFIAALKTTYKPRHELPILWLVIFENGLLFCSTHKTRGVFKNIFKDKIDSIKLKHGTKFGVGSLEILFIDLREDNFVVTLPNKLNFNKLESILLSQNYQIIN